MKQYSVANNDILNPLDENLENFYSSNNLQHRRWKSLENGILISILVAAPNCAFSSENMSHFQNHEIMGFSVQDEYSFDVDQNVSLLFSDKAGVSLIPPRNIEEKFKSSPIVSFCSSLSSLKNSYSKNVVSKFSKFKTDNFDSFFRKIARLPFYDNIVQYDSSEETLDVTLWFDENLRLIINKFIEDDDDNVIFSIYHDKKLLVCDEISVEELVKKITPALEQTA